MLGRAPPLLMPPAPPARLAVAGRERSACATCCIGGAGAVAGSAARAAASRAAVGVPGREAAGVPPAGVLPLGVPAPGVLASLAPPSQRVLVLERTAFQSGSFCG